MSNLNVVVTYRGVSHPLSLDPHSTVLDMKLALEALTTVPPSLQKLLYRGKKNVENEASASVEEAGLKDKTRVTLIGSTNEELSQLRTTETESRRREEIMRQRQAKGPTKVASTSTPSLNYRFQRIEPLPHLPNPPAARELLERLAADAAIQHVMTKHRFSVGLLTELAPHEHPNLLGLNENAGQSIKLRLRTDAYDGMRLYKDVRRVLCHELTHNVHGDHNDDFKTLNSTLNREVDEFERSVKQGSHSLSGFQAGDYYDPASSTSSTLTGAEVHSHVLGGGTGSSSILLGSREEMRRRALEAALERQRKQDQEIEDMCGSNEPASMS